MIADEAEYIVDKDSDEEDPYLIESKPTKKRFLVYEEKYDLS